MPEKTTHRIRAHRGDARERLDVALRRRRSPSPSFMRTSTSSPWTNPPGARGWPIVGDPVYGEPRWKGIPDPTLAALCRDFPRQALHARRLVFVHPMTREPVEIVAPVPEDLGRLLAAAGMENV
jgi:hypothetical protein